MSVTLNYGSTSLGADLDSLFDNALLQARSEIPEPLAHIVDGQAHAVGEVFERRDPAGPDRVVARAHTASQELVAAAVQAARAAAKSWRADYVSRGERLRAAKPLFAEHAVRIAATISAETGKSRIEALAEAQESIDLIEHYCAQMETNNGFVTPLQSKPTESNTDVLRPYGVFGVLAPFNFPVALAVNMATAALVTGNTVVIKPSDKTPRSTALAVELLATALPAGVLNLVHGGGEVGRILSESDIDGLAFTGSAQVGWELVRTLGRGSFAKPVLAEMGGQNPAIVMASADLDDAVEGIVRSAFGFSGQKCSATRRVIADASIHDTLVSKLTTRMEQLVVADPSVSDMFIGPVADEHIAAQVDAALDQAAAEGTIVTGGRRTDLPGYFVAPTLIAHLPRGHRLTRNELFAPVITVTAVEGIDDAINEANAVDYGLSAGIFTASAVESEQFLDEIEAGVVYVNRREGATTGAWPGVQSFCGWKASGSSGKGGLGPWYLQGFVREQSRTLAISSSNQETTR
ncbi:aldehyde dehydrogenase family protein [Rhodococcus sp. ABRD24]|uniref:aldehyde dehydrogenase family protein n=1 Tax=Rhodococcus sp. ABRD24 TaxID=2507582 RepID=UPI001038C3AE|nr:aldehyde dehydrogenase family protein [Rhodococcus sp. ABRD24]QBJ96007.1 aldehyde dehydrogenase family protein [Rhodococcus sp. ABRD24]